MTNSITNNNVNSISSSHCRNVYLREYAHKTIPGMDIQYGDYLPDLRRIKKQPVKSDMDINKFVAMYNNRPGQYVSVYSFSELIQLGDNDKDGFLYEHKYIGTIKYNSAKIDRLYLDFDDKENPQKSIDEALTVISVMAKHKIFCHAYFSGNKGIGLYFEFRCVDIAAENKKEVIAGLFDLIRDTTEAEKNIKLTTLDHQVRGDIARVSRIPNTVNKGLYCIPVTFGDMRKGIGYIKTKAINTVDCDLGNIIVSNMRRNITLPIIIKNIEKEVIQARETKLKLDKLKADYYKKATRHHSDTNGITDEMIQKARSVSLSSVIGSSKLVVCPLHNDSQPSLKIDHHKGLWYCFGCGKGGDVVTFVMEKNNMDFKTAIRTLAGVN